MDLYFEFLVCSDSEDSDEDEDSSDDEPPRSHKGADKVLRHVYLFH